MKVYLINLDKDKERLAAADAQLKRLGVAYERVSAVYGKDLTVDEKRNAVNRFRWRVAMGRPIRDGEIGCALSHFKIYRDLKEGICCVLEDDVVLEREFAKVLSDVERWIDPLKPQVVLLSDHTHANISDHVILPAKSDMFTESYVITAPAAAAILEANFPMRTPCDHWGRWVKQGAIELYHAYPTVCNQNWTGFESNIGKSCEKLTKRPFLERVFRHLGFALDRLILLFERVK